MRRSGAGRDAAFMRQNRAPEEICPALERKSCQLLLVFAAGMVKVRHMAQGLQLSQRLTQSLVLAPQLQQSLALLQAPTLELKALVEQELQQNPVLEESPVAEVEQNEKDGKDDDKTEAADLSEPPVVLGVASATEKPSNEPVDDFQ